MNLHEAVKAVAAFIGKEDLDVVKLSGGHVYAYNGVAGARAPCEVTKDFPTIQVSGQRLRKAVDALGSSAAIIQGTKKTLTLGRGSGSFRLPAAPGRLPVPRSFNQQWSEVPEGVAAAVGALAPLLERDDSLTAFALDTVRCTPHWTAGGNGRQIGVVWTAIVQDAYIPAGILKGVSGQLNIATTQNHVFIHDSTEVIRWTGQRQAEWPDSVIAEIPHYRSSTLRRAVTVELSELHDLASQAVAAMDTKAETFRLTLDDSKLWLHGKAQLTNVEFEGVVDVDGPGGKALVVGMNPIDLVKVAKVLREVGEAAYMSVAGPYEPVILWISGDVTLEVLCMPQHLPGGI